MSAADQLVDPVAEPQIPTAVSTILGASSFVSPTYWINEVLGLITSAIGIMEPSPLEWVAEQVSGDWEAAAKVGDSASNLAEFHTDWAADLEKSLADMLHEWEGNAADAANKYFTDLKKAVQQQVGELKSLSTGFDTMATGVASLGRAIKSGIEIGLDMALVAAANWAAAAASSWTVVGGAAFAATATAFTAYATSEFVKVVGLFGQVWAVAEAFIGVCAGFLGGADLDNLKELPGGSYDHPGVK